MEVVVPLECIERTSDKFCTGSMVDVVVDEGVSWAPEDLEGVQEGITKDLVSRIVEETLIVAEGVGVQGHSKGIMIGLVVLQIKSRNRPYG